MGLGELVVSVAVERGDLDSELWLHLVICAEHRIQQLSNHDPPSFPWLEIADSSCLARKISF